MTNDIVHWQKRLDDLAEHYRVPGASLAILADDDIATAATGVINRDTAVPATTDSVFQIGSITKVWTATLLMQLADQGRLDLDAPLATVLPELTLATPGATEQITVRHLLSHSSGIDGDMLDDAGRGDDCIARYVAKCSRLAVLCAPGATMSYCNAGFSIAGRIVECVTGGTWDAQLRSNLIEPLGLSHTVTLPEEAIRFRAAYGHIDIDGKQQLAPLWALPGGAGPAGGIAATASDVITFVELHLREGRTADGTELLSAAAAAAMRTPQVTVPGPDQAEWGLGWALFDWNGHQVFGHDGGTFGQAAFLRVLPGRGGAVCLLTNGGQAGGLYRDLVAEIFQTLWQVDMPAQLAPLPDPLPVDQARYAGRYEREGVRLDVEADGTGLAMTSTSTGALADVLPDPVRRLSLSAVADDVFVTRSAADEPWRTLVFYQVGGRWFLHDGGRATPRRG